MTYDTSDTGPNDNTADGDSTFNSIDTAAQSILSTGSRIVTASSYASSGAGQTGDPYIGGIQEAHDDTAGFTPEAPSSMAIVDGRFKDTVVLTDGPFGLVGTSWGSIIENDGGNPVVTVQTTDITHENMWLIRGDSSDIVVLVDGPNGANEEYHAEEIEYEGGATGLYIDQSDRAKLESLMFQNNTDYGLIVNNSQYCSGTNLHSENTIQLSNGTSNISLSNVVVEQSSSTGDQGGIVVKDTCTDNFISGTVTQAYGTGVVLGGSRNVFVGQSHGNTTGFATDVDINFTGGAVECVAIGYFGNGTAGVANWGTRCVLNGHSVNAGDPSTTGDWNGFENLAANMGVTVWDTNTSPNTAYKVDPSGNWVAI